MDEFMQSAIEEARTAKKEGCAAFGAVLVRNGKIISAARNMTDFNQQSLALLPSFEPHLSFAAL